MDFRQFRYFAVAAEELHFARAAEKLGIAQPALSQQIKSLEKQLGARLFHRAKRGVTLTETGAAFLHEVRETLSQAEKAVRTAKDMARGEAGHIDIGLVGSVMFEPRFPRLLTDFRKNHPGVHVSLHEMPILTQIDGVKSRRLDIAIIRDPVPPNALDEVGHFTLSSQRLLAVLPKAHHLAAAREIRFADLANDPFVAFADPAGVGLGQALLDRGHAAGFEPRITQKVSEITTLVSLVTAGFGVGLVAETVRHLRLPGVCYRPLADVDALSNLIVIHRRFESSVAVRVLLDNILDASRSEWPLGAQASKTTPFLRMKQP